MKHWKDIKPGDVIRIPRGTRRGPTTFTVESAEPSNYQRDSTTVTGTSLDPKRSSWVVFTKTDGYTGFTVKGEKEFEDDE